MLFPAGLAAAAGVAACVWVAAALALVFVYCQARMLQAAKGIPAWREPLLVPLVLTTGLTEGGGLLLLAAPLTGVVTPLLLVAFGLLLIGRVLVWQAYRRRLVGVVVRGAASALDRAGQVLQLIGTPVPLALVALIVAGAVPDAQVPLLAAIAGLAAAVAGAYVKFTLVTRAAFNQGFALAHLPVRGQPR